MSKTHDVTFDYMGKDIAEAFEDIRKDDRKDYYEMGVSWYPAAPSYREFEVWGRSYATSAITHRFASSFAEGFKRLLNDECDEPAPNPPAPPALETEVEPMRFDVFTTEPVVSVIKRIAQKFLDESELKDGES